MASPPGPSPGAVAFPADGFGDFAALDVYVIAVASAMALIALALWVASYTTDRVALRLFALRYALATLGWAFVHPRAQGGPGDVPLAAVMVGIGLTTLTVCALESYIGQLDRRRLLAIVGIGAAVALFVVLIHRIAPRDPRPVYLALAAGMAYCAVAARQAAQRERNVGHRLIAAAFASYPLVVVATLLFGPTPPGVELGYVAALPLIVVGIVILVASLIRFGRRLEVELARREAAERAVREANASLERRVAERTTELRLIVDGLESFARNVSHDLRGPLTGLAGVARFAHEAIGRGDVARAEALLEPIANQADRLVDLVNDLATLARLHDAPPRRAPQPMREVVDEALRQLAASPDTAAMLERVSVVVDDLPTVSVDAGLMRQVFVNLLGNALRFAARGYGRAQVRVGAAPQDGELAFFVSDSGPGFPPERAGELFRPFVRMHGGDLSRNGIGLSIVRRIVEAHGGRVWAESRPGEGTTFRFALRAAA